MNRRSSRGHVPFATLLLASLLTAACSESPEEPSVDNDVSDGVPLTEGTGDTSWQPDSSDMSADSANDRSVFDAEPDSFTDVEVSDQSVDEGSVDATTDLSDSADSATDRPISLQIHTLDIWAERLREPSLELGQAGGDLELVAGLGPFDWVLPQAGDYRLVLQAPDHHPMRLRISYDGSGAASGLVVANESDEQKQGVSIVRDPHPSAGHPAVELFLGLRHRWFSASGRPARYGNRLELLMDGEEAWQLFWDRVSIATATVHASTWWWESDFELLRPTPDYYTYSEAERQQNTVLELFDTVDATVRVLVWQDNLVSWLTVDDQLTARGAAAGDGFEFMGMTNETEGVFDWEIRPFSFRERVIAQSEGFALEDFDTEQPIASTIPPRSVDLSDWPLGVELDVQMASWHQKFFVVDGDEGFVGGMNLRRADWDTSEHHVFEGRRMLFDSSNDDRRDVQLEEQEPDYAPRKDYMVYVTGPAVQDVEEVFHTRWSHQIASRREHWENASNYSVVRDMASFVDGAAVQITTTMPSPFQEHSILESWVNAVGNAEDFILIEDQYWRAPLLTEAIIERMEERSELVLIVVTNPIDEYLDPGCEWTHITHHELESRFPDRYYVYSLRTFDTAVSFGFDETDAYFVDVGIHSKLLIVDDRFMSVGSANKNNRGLIYEGEMNIAVLDSAWVGAARERVVSNMLGFERTSADGLARAFAAVANWNALVYSNWESERFDLSLDGDPLPGIYQPAGFIYPLDFRTSDYCLIEGIGEDMM